MAVNTLGLNLSAMILTDGQDMRFQERITKLVRFANLYRGIQSVKTVTRPLESGPFKGREALRFTARGTEKAIRAIQDVIDIAGFEMTEFETHDHQRCLESARENGVPASWAHMQETYLSM